jgi:hypothetical protein
MTHALMELSGIPVHPGNSTKPQDRTSPSSYNFEYDHETAGDEDAEEQQHEVEEEHQSEEAFDQNFLSVFRSNDQVLPRDWYNELKFAHFPVIYFISCV